MSQRLVTQNQRRNAEQAEHPAGDVRREGERLDEARAEFRVAWAAKVSKKRRQAAWTRLRAASLHRIVRDIRIAGAILGAIVGAMNLTGGPGIQRFLAGALLGMLLGLLMVTPLLFLIEGSAGANHLKADCLEREARELERQVD